MKKMIGILLAALLLLACLPVTALADEPIGKVTVSITDNGDRDYLLDYCDEEEMAYLEPFGVIVAPTEVPIYEGDTAADALVRLFEMKGITYNAWGTTETGGGFYLTDITFTKDGTLVENFGEGSITPDDDLMRYFSGWMVTLNNWFTSSGICDYLAEDGDIIRMQYTCSMGADVGNDYSNPSAAITGIVTEDGEISPAFSADTKAYTLTVGEDTESVRLSVTNANYGSVVTYTVGETSYKYMRAIPVANGTVITVNSKYYASNWDDEVGGYVSTLADEDEITVTVVKPEPETPPATDEPSGGSGNSLSMIGEYISTFISFLRQIIDMVTSFFKGLVK